MTDPGAIPPIDGGRASPPGEASGALDRVLAEADFRGVFAGLIAPIFAVESSLGTSPAPATAVLSRLVVDAERLDTRLRAVGARGNKTFAFVAEALPLLRALAQVQHALLHLRVRLARGEAERGGAPPAGDLDAALEWTQERLRVLLRAVRDDVVGPIGADLHDRPLSPPAVRADERWRLAQDLDVPVGRDPKDRIAAMATAFLAIGDDLARVPLPDPAEREHAGAGLAAVVADRFGVAEAEEARAGMHALQSTYDSVVAGTSREDGVLLAFRGEVSVLLHALEAVAHGLLARRHLLDEVRSAPLRDRLAALVDPEALLGGTLGFGLRFAQRRFAAARPLATSLLEAATRMAEVVLPLPPGRKLHLRPAGLIVKVVQRHGLPVEMGMGTQSVDARHLMDVILLAAGNPTETKVRFRGDERPLADLEALFRERLGEDGTAGFPPALSYLRVAEDPRKSP